MTDQERYHTAVLATFAYLYGIDFDDFIAEITGRIKTTGYNISDCTCALHRGLEHEAREAEKMRE